MELQAKRMREVSRPFRELRDRAHDQMLDNLSDEHKRLLAKLIGQLSVAKVPDLETVASELDEALSPRRNEFYQSDSVCI